LDSEESPEGVATLPSESSKTNQKGKRGDIMNFLEIEKVIGREIK